MTISTKIIGAFVAIFGVALAVSTVNAQTANAACVDNIYKQGSSSVCVKYVQQMLNGQTKYNGQDPYHASPLAGLSLLATDSVFGSKTRARVVILQKWQKIDPDGAVGIKTWTKLCSVTADAYYEIGGSLVTTGYNAGKSAGCAKLGSY
jgi:peptidoglycan hydrolase-like protein with peptidoglycan-binding domain